MWSNSVCVDILYLEEKKKLIFSTYYTYSEITIKLLAW